jgi:hypothetical protein
MIEIIGIIVGIVGIIFGIIELISKWSKIKAWFHQRLIKIKLKNVAKESLRVHASPRKNVFTIKRLKSDFNSNVSLNVSIDDNGISLGAYDTENSPMYLFTTFPTKLLLPLPIQEDITWEESGESNMGFSLKAVSNIPTVNKNIEVPAGKFVCVRVDTIFEVPLSYTGPIYTKKSIWWAHGVGPVKIKVHFNDSEPCVGELLNYEVVKEDSFWPMTTQNYWEYLWRLNRPNNNRNVSETTIEINSNFLS